MASIPDGTKRRKGLVQTSERTEAKVVAPVPVPEKLTEWAGRLGLELDEQQRRILEPGIRRGILNCCRKWGKSTMIALKAAHFAVERPGTTVLVVAPSARQSEELLAIAGGMLYELEIPAQRAKERVKLANGSRMVALPNQPRTIRGFSPELLVVDEAAYLPEEIWDAVFPMLNAAEGGGWLWLMSTPAQPTGFFHQIWTSKMTEWTRVKVTAEECPRISPEMVEEARRTFTPDRFAREYLGEFAQPPTAAFPELLVRSCLQEQLPEFFGSRMPWPLPAAPHRARPWAYVGLDLGKSQDPSALAVVEFAMEPTGTIDPASRAPLFRSTLTLRHLESPPLGTEYLTVAQRALDVTRHARVKGRCTLVPDVGGVGAPVLEVLRRTQLNERAPIVPVVITGGQQVVNNNGTYSVPRTVLMDRLEYLLRVKKLRLAAGPLTEQLVKELMLLEREVRESGHVAFRTPTSTAHDDLVMATALAVWQAWETHQRYLEAEGPVPLVGVCEMFDTLPAHPLTGGRLMPPGWWWRRG